MSDDFEDLKLTTTHEWVRKKAKTIVVGITDFGQQLLSDVTGVELPEPDDVLYNVRDELGVIESVRTTVDFHAPVGGTVVKVNSELLANPEMVNTDPFGKGWLVEMKPDHMAEIDELMDFDEYEASLPDEDE
jgi:glycine cleavage system H protein